MGSPLVQCNDAEESDQAPICLQYIIYISIGQDQARIAVDTMEMMSKH